MAESIGNIEVPASRAVGKLTVEVTLIGVRSMRWRMGIGIALMRFGIWITGMGASIDIADDDTALQEAAKETLGVKEDIDATATD